MVGTALLAPCIRNKLQRVVHKRTSERLAVDAKIPCCSFYVSRKILNPLYILFWLIVDVAKYYYLLGVAVLAFITAASLVPSSFAQQDSSPQLNITSTDAPVLQQVSEKGIYLVELKWPLVVADAEDALQVEIVFNNASAPLPTSNTIPQRESNVTGSGDVERALTIPGAIGGEPMPVESYDMAIYTPDGRKLWEQLDQPGQGGRGTQRIDLDSNYTGPVTIDISDIRPGEGGNETSTATDMADSVKFSVTIVPEFPIATVLLAIGIIIVTVAVHGRRQRLI